MSKADTKLTPQPVRINRRQALASGGAALSVGAAASVPAAVAGADDPDRELVELGNRRRRLYAMWTQLDLAHQLAKTQAANLANLESEPTGGDDKTAFERENDRLLAELRRLETEIAATPASGHAGIAVKLQIVVDLADMHPEDFDAFGELKQIRSAYADAERLAGAT